MVCMRDERFDRLYARWRAADVALQSYLAAGSRQQDAQVKSVLVRQLQTVAWRRYGQLQKHLCACRARLQQL